MRRTRRNNDRRWGLQFDRIQADCAVSEAFLARRFGIGDWENGMVVVTLGVDVLYQICQTQRFYADYLKYSRFLEGKTMARFVLEV